MVELKEAVNNQQTTKQLQKVMMNGAEAEKQSKRNALKVDGIEVVELIDLELVGEFRELLRDEFEKNEDLYCKAHYNDLMNPAAPIVSWRYLAYMQSSVQDAVDLAIKALIYRKENDIDNSSNHQQVKEFWLYTPLNLTGKLENNTELIYLIGRDYRRVGGWFSKIVINFIQHLLFGLDKRHAYDEKKITLVFDVTNTGLSNTDLDFMAWLVKAADLLPSRVHKIYVIGIPFILRPIVRLIISWAPQRLSSLIKCCTFEEMLSDGVSLDVIPCEAGGKLGDSFRLAPLDAPWLEDSAEYNKKKIIDAIEYSLLGNFSAEKKQRLKKMQIEYELDNDNNNNNNNNIITK